MSDNLVQVFYDENGKMLGWMPLISDAEKKKIENAFKEAKEEVEKHLKKK